MKGFVKKYWPALLASLVLVIISVLVYRAVLEVTGGVFVYALDDAYIHMAMAKNVVAHGVWGVTPHEFSSSSSSPLWIVILSLVYLITGVKLMMPFILNIIFSFLSLLMLQKLLHLFILNKVAIFSFLVGCIILLPIPIQIVSGMEHMLQVFFTLWFVYELFNDVSPDWRLYAAGAFMTATRYENMFLVVVVSLILFSKKYVKKSVFVLSASLVPIISYGLVSLLNGWFFLPNGLLVKTRAGDPLFVIDRFLKSFLYVPERIFETQLYILFLFLLIVFLFVIFRKITVHDSKIFLLLKMFLGASFFHLLFARVGWLFRYDIYLLTLGLMFLFVMIFDVFSRDKWSTIQNKFSTLVIIGMVSLIVGLSFIPRIQIASYATIYASKNIYTGYHHLGQFVGKYYNNASIAATDIGAITFYSDARLVDMLGLGDVKIGRSMMNNGMTKEVILQRIQENDVRVVFAFDEFVREVIEDDNGSVPWTLVGEWEVTEENLLVRHAVQIFATNESGIEQLRNNLLEHNRNLPDGIKSVVY